jgi:hypothetical protein
LPCSDVDCDYSGCIHCDVMSIVIRRYDEEHRTSLHNGSQNCKIEDSVHSPSMSLCDNTFSGFYKEHFTGLTGVLRHITSPLNGAVGAVAPTTPSSHFSKLSSLATLAAASSSRPSVPLLQLIPPHMPLYAPFTVRRLFRRSRTLTFFS